MYGTIARVKIDPARLPELKALGDSMGTGAGQVARYIYQMDADPGEIFLVAIFESQDAYWTNANSPEQNERFMQMRALLLEEPQWHDGKIISAA